MSQPQPTTSLSGSLFRLILLISSFPLRETIYIHEYEGFGETASVSQRHRLPKYVSRLHPPMEIEDRIFWLVIQHGQYVSKGKVRSERERGVLRKVGGNWPSATAEPLFPSSLCPSVNPNGLRDERGGGRRPASPPPRV